MPKTTVEPTVHVIDDDPGVRRSLKWLIESVGLAVRTYEDGVVFLRQLPAPPGCIVLDIRLPHMDGLDVQDALNGRGAGMPLIFISSHADVPTATRAMRAGAANVIQKPFSDEDLLEQVERAVEQNVAAQLRDAELLCLRRRYAQLTARERQVLQHVVDGEPNKAIARLLGVTPKTVEAHRGKIMRKMGANSAAQLVRYAVLVTPN